jgi:hypothetical protein
MITVTSDLGSEFKKIVKQYLKAKNIRQYNNDPNFVSAKTHMAIIERFNKTIWTKIKKYTASKGNFKFIDKIPLFIKNYNNCKHNTTTLKPIDVF